MANFGQWATQYDVQGCGAILFAGSTFYVGLLPNCATEAPEYTLTVDGAGAIGANSFTATATSSLAGVTTTTLRKGGRLTLSGGAVAVVNADTSITLDGTTSNTIPVQALTTAIAVAETATTWSLLEFQAPTDIPLNSTDTVTDTTSSANGLQGAETKTNVALKIPVQGFLTNGDPSIRYIHDASQVDSNVTVVAARTGGIYAIGRAIISNISYPGTVKDVVKMSFDVSMQPSYSFTAPSWTWTTAEKTLMNPQLQLAGIPIVN